MNDAPGFHLVVLQVSLHGIELSDRIAQWGTCGKEHAAAVVPLLQVTALNEKVECLFRACQIPQARYPTKRGGDEQVLEFLSLIDNQGINTQPCLTAWSFEPVSAFFSRRSVIRSFAFSISLMVSAIALAALEVENRVREVLDLLLQQLLERFRWHTDFLERAVRHYHCIPVPSNPGKQPLAVFFLEIRLLCYQHVGVGIQIVEGIFPLQ